ncbi:hypothetical protein B0H63DRAFT_196098 [Podospora didyma]|uniref:Uncharacterized protein n=1 Tax=Podospora didyma TaxID=330526 RepID=A0AAE0NGH9_9PEZI|nr:hypothetical protein B0H63DRAFT_196098 [Podospora didyma]
MGAYISIDTCARQYGTNPNCSITFFDIGRTNATSLGGATPGNFEPDADIAGIGVLGAFLAVTLFSLLMSIGSTLWWCSKNILHFKSMVKRDEKSVKKKWQISIAGILETLILTCSDQQIFTGGAYAITLRYFKGCTISAYHYNIVANMLLVTCATHLMAVTVSRHYWEHVYVGFLRVAVTALVYLVTGVLLSNQGGGNAFPTEVPPASAQYSEILMPAACFQNAKFSFGDNFKGSFASSNDFFRARIPGWTQFLVMFIFYALAVLINLGRLIRRGTGHNGKRRKFVNWLKTYFAILFRAKRLLYILFSFYLFAGIGIASWTVATSAMYVLELRSWVDKSIWMDKNNGKNPENDPATFGQLVPVLLITLVIFTFLQILSERMHARKKYHKNRGNESPSGQRSPNNTVVKFNPKGSSDSPPESRWIDKSVIGVAISDPEELDRIAAIDAGATAAHARSQSRGSDARGRSTTPLSRPPPVTTTSLTSTAKPPPMYTVFPSPTMNQSPMGSPNIGSSSSDMPPPVPKKSRSREFSRSRSGSISPPDPPRPLPQKELRPSRSRDFILNGGANQQQQQQQQHDRMPSYSREAPSPSMQQHELRPSRSRDVTSPTYFSQQQHELRPSRSRDFRRNGVASPSLDQIQFADGRI